MPRLRRSACTDAGIRRLRRGRGFVYLDDSGEPINDEQTLSRIRELAIPPAWTDVWICLDPLGHLQATGTDGAGRKQYLYHERWRSRRDQQKFDSMLEFARAVPRLRRQIERTLPAETLDRDCVLACAAHLLDIGFFRIGGEEYAEANGSYGLTTMLREHVSFDGDTVIFDYPAKSGQRREQAISDPIAARMLRKLKRRRSGTRLLAYRRDGAWHELGADELNDYLKAQLGGDFSAKDFRTWNATVLAAVTLAAIRERAPQGSKKRAISETVKTVAFYLGNTPAVCRASYIDPRVFDRFSAGSTISPGLKSRDRIERAVIHLLEPGRSKKPSAKSSASSNGGAPRSARSAGRRGSQRGRRPSSAARSPSRGS